MSFIIKNPIKDQYGNIRGVYHEGEMILSEKQRRELASLGINDREELFDVVRKQQLGSSAVNEKGELVPVISQEVIKKIDETNKLLKELPNSFPVSYSGLDRETPHVVNTTMKQKDKIIKARQSVKSWATK